MQERNAIRLVRTYTRASRWQQRFMTHVNAAFNGLWLGVMDRGAIDLIDEIYYREHAEYADDAYNTKGLVDWEAAAVDEHFPEGGRVVVTGAGAGREVLALLERDFDAVGFEPNRELVSAGTRLLERRGHGGRLHVVERDAFPDDAGDCQAILVGWSSYMLIPGRLKRTEFLRAARRRLPENAPILLSFFARDPQERSYTTTASVANLCRRLRGRAPVELGDTLTENYTHRFTRDEIASELREGGFRLAAYKREPYPHAVGRAASV